VRVCLTLALRGTNVLILAKYEMKYFETSALDGSNVMAAFRDIIQCSCSFIDYQLSCLWPHGLPRVAFLGCCLGCYVRTVGDSLGAAAEVLVDKAEITANSSTITCCT
jgi:hypothetical protein